MGTSTFLTDANGVAYQFFLNLPFGETMAEQRPSTYFATNYKFNGKELDEETGLYYYGARYYDPRISIWLSTDPLAEKFPNASPYNYCMQNPINLIDPDGRAPDWHREGSVLVADEGDTAETLAEYKGISLQEARAEFNHSHFHFESTMSGGEKFYGSDRYNPSGAFGPSYGPEMDEKISLGIIGAIAAPLAAVEGGLGYLAAEGLAALSEVTLTSATVGVTTNTFSQYLANQGDVGKINWIEAGSNIVPGIAPVVIGETFSYSTSNGFQTPNSFAQWSAQVGGGILSNRFGNATDNYLGNSFSSQVVGEFFKFQIETASNIAPNFVK
jgi:RHS repeat-associated protein